VSTEPSAELALELLVLRAQAARLHRVLEHDQRALERERLLKKVVGAQLGGLHRGLNGAVAADDDHFRPHLGGQRAHLGQHVEAVAIGQPDVEQNHVVGRVAQQHHGLGRRGRVATP
jgi:hypothetical protein